MTLKISFGEVIVYILKINHPFHLKHDPIQ
jgi:hypothetical protein